MVDVSGLYSATFSFLNVRCASLRLAEYYLVGLHGPMEGNQCHNKRKPFAVCLGFALEQ